MGHSWLFQCRASVPATAFPSRLSQNTCPRITRCESPCSNGSKSAKGRRYRCLLSRLDPFQGGFWIDSHPKGGRDLIDRHVLIPFDERRVRDVPESAATEEGETHTWAKNASKHAWSRSEIP